MSEYMRCCKPFDNVRCAKKLKPVTRFVAKKIAKYE